MIETKQTEHLSFSLSRDCMKKLNRLSEQRCSSKASTLRYLIMEVKE